MKIKTKQKKLLKILFSIIYPKIIKINEEASFPISDNNQCKNKRNVIYRSVTRNYS